MGRGRYIYIQDEIDEKLQKVVNKSKLVNELLTEYFRKIELDGLTDGELKKELAIAKLKKEFEAKQEKIRNG